MKSVISRIAIASVALGLAGTTWAQASTINITDNFDRPGGDTVNTLGTMSDGIHSWTEVEGGSGEVKIYKDQLDLYYGTTSTPGASVTSVQLQDGQIELDYSVQEGGVDTNRFSGITYRAGSQTDGASIDSAHAYHVVIASDWSGANDLYLRYGSDVLAQANLGNTFDNVDLKVTFSGNHHIVTVDGNTVIDYNETAADRTGAGYLGVGVHFTRQRFSLFSASGTGVVPEPGSLALLGLGGLAVLGRKRRGRIAL